MELRNCMFYLFILLSLFADWGCPADPVMRTYISTYIEIYPVIETLFGTCSEIVTQDITTTLTTITETSTSVIKTTTTTTIYDNERLRYRTVIPQLVGRNPSNQSISDFIIYTTYTTFTTITLYNPCSITLSVTIPGQVLTLPVTQKIVVDILDVVTQTVVARNPNSITAPAKTSASTSSYVAPAVPSPVPESSTDQEPNTSFQESSKVPHETSAESSDPETSVEQQPITDPPQKPPFVSQATTMKISESPQAPQVGPAAVTQLPGYYATTVGGIPVIISTITSGTGIVVGDSSLKSGQAITSNGYVFSNGPSGLVISTINVPGLGEIIQSFYQPFTSPSVSGVVFNGNTLTSGGTIVVSETTYVLPTGGTVPAVLMPVPSSMTIGLPSQKLGVVFDGHTLTEGGVTTISSTIYSLQSGSTAPVIIVPASITPARSTQDSTSHSAAPTFAQPSKATRRYTYSIRAIFVVIFMGTVTLCFYL